MLTPKQKAFADYYIQLGNATEAARRAGYSPQTADRIANQNLRKLEISQYIAERTKPDENKRIADADEVMRFFTSVMRGEVKDQFGLDPSLKDRTDAAKELAKRTVDRQQKDTGMQREDDPVTKALREEARRLENGTE